MTLGMNAQVSAQEAWWSRPSVVAPASMALDQVEQTPMQDAGWPWASVVAPTPVKLEVQVQLQMLEP